MRPRRGRRRCSVLPTSLPATTPTAHLDVNALSRHDQCAHSPEATDRFRNGELDAFDADQVLFQYSRAARELWKFCNVGDVELTARQVHEGPPIDWWERGTRGRPVP